MMKITPKQVERVYRLVRELCANCDEDGNCILLDDGEAHRCVQPVSYTHLDVYKRQPR